MASLGGSEGLSRWLRTQWSSVSPHLALEFLRGGGERSGEGFDPEDREYSPVEVNTFHRRPANLPPSQIPADKTVTPPSPETAEREDGGECFKGECVKNYLRLKKKKRERKEPSAYI